MSPINITKITNVQMCKQRNCEHQKVKYTCVRTSTISLFYFFGFLLQIFIDLCLWLFLFESINLTLSLCE